MEDRIQFKPGGTSYWLMASVALLLGISCAALWSASQHAVPGVAEAAQYHVKQWHWILLALPACGLACAVPYLRYGRLAYGSYLALLFLLVLVKFFGVVQNGARSWFDLGFLYFQPSELMKLAVILTLGWYLRYKENLRTWRGLLGPFVLTMAPCLIILEQPDLGTALLFPPILLAMLYAAGARRQHLASVIVFGLLLLPVAYFFVLHDYQRARITAFLHPAAYQQRESYQLIQSLDAIGSGGVLGKGWGKGTQNMLDFIPTKHNDFIFSVIGEEWGFAGALLLVSAFSMFLFATLRVAYNTREPFARLVAVGVATMFATQIGINIGMTIGLMPITGITLPLISYGGSSLLTSMLAVGLVLNISTRRVLVLKEEPDDRAYDFTWQDSSVPTNSVGQPRRASAIYSNV